MVKNKKPIKLFVGEVLEDSLAARDSDHVLVFMVLERMGFARFYDGKVVLYMNSFDTMPSMEGITRCRRHFQNDDGEFIGSAKVDELRKEYQEKYKENAVLSKINTGPKYNQ